MTASASVYDEGNTVVLRATDEKGRYVWVKFHPDTADDVAHALKQVARAVRRKP